MTNRDLWEVIVSWTKDDFTFPPNPWVDASNEEHKMPIHYTGPIGTEHYRMLSELVWLIDKEDVVDIGTYEGCSALAMAANPNVKVISYDIINRIKRLPKEDNIEYVVENLLRSQDLPETRIIMLDVDPHDAVQEPMFMKLFAEVGYKGIVICDDIHLSDHMNAWWNDIELEKFDITSIGHHSGTGMVYFD